MASKPFRQESVDQVASPEGLGAFIQVVSPRDALGALGLCAVSFVVLVWVVLGTVRVGAEGSGVLLRPDAHPLAGLRADARLSDLEEPQLVQRIAALEAQLALESSQRSEAGTLRHDQIALEQDHVALQLERIDARITRVAEGAEADRAARAASIAGQAPALASREAEAEAVVTELKAALASSDGLRESGAISPRELLAERHTLLAAQADLDAVRAARQRLAVDRAGDVLALERVARELDGLRAEREALEVRRLTLERSAVEADAASHNALATLVRELDQARLVLESRRHDDEAVGTEPAPPDDLVAVIFMDAAAAKRVRPGMEVHVSPDSVERERYGSVRGTVREVSTWPVTPSQAEALLANPRLADALAGSGRAVLLVASLTRDPDDDSGYSWTTARSPQIVLSPGTTLTAEVTLERRSPITYLLPALRSLVGSG